MAVAFGRATPSLRQAPLMCLDNPVLGNIIFSLNGEHHLLLKVLHFRVDKRMIKVTSLEIQQGDKTVAEPYAQIQKRIKESKEFTNQFNQLIWSCKSRESYDLYSMKDFFERVTSEQELTALIEKTYAGKKEAQKEIGNYVGQLLKTELENILKGSGNSIFEEVHKLLIKRQRNSKPIQRTQATVNIGNLDFNASTFDSQAAFAGGLAGLATFILVITISWHIAIGIVSAIWVTILIYYLTTSWQKSLAKNIARQIHEKSIWDKIEKSINNFWDTTEGTLSLHLEEICRQDDKYIESLKKQIVSKPINSRNRRLVERIGGVAARAIGAYAAPAATYSLVSTFGTAGTGAAISSLSGAAATSATLACLGFGTMAGGAVVLGGIAVAGGWGAKKLYRHIWKS